MSKHKENVARETMGNKDGLLRGIMAKVNIRRNAELKEAMGKAITKREVHKAWKECHHIMSKLDKGTACTRRTQELAMPTESPHCI